MAFLDTMTTAIASGIGTAIGAYVAQRALIKQIEKLEEKNKKQ